MSRKILALALVTLLFGAVYAMANRDAVTESDSAPVAVAQSGNEFGFGGVIASRPTVLALAVKRPIEIPNHVLEPGNYTFRLLEDDNFVVVATTTGKVIGMCPIIPATRDTAPDNVSFRLAEVPGSATMRLAAWYYPGDRDGFAFIYPHAKHARVFTAQK